jgi:hypothetical protein
VLVADGVAGSPLLALASPLLALASLLLALADGVAGADEAGVTAGCSTWALVWSGVGIAAGICDAAAAAAEPFSVGPWHGLRLLRCVLSVGGPLVPSGAPDVSVGVGPEDPVGEVGAWVGEAGSDVGVAAGEL